MRFGPDDGEAALLVRVEPGQVQVRHEARREAHEAEDHVLDARVHVGLAEGVALVGLLPGEPQHHRHVVRAERPERVLLGAQLAEVEAVAVDVADVAELAGLDQLAQALEARGGTRAGAPPSASRPASRGGVDHRLRRPRPTARAASRRSSACPPRARAAPARRGWAPAWRSPRRRGPRPPAARRATVVRRAPGSRAPTCSSRSAESSQIQVSSAAGQAVEVARQVRPPVAEPDDPHRAPARSRGGPGRGRPPPRSRPARRVSRGPIGSARLVARQLVGHRSAARRRTAASPAGGAPACGSSPAPPTPGVGEAGHQLVGVACPRPRRGGRRARRPRSPAAAARARPARRARRPPATPRRASFQASSSGSSTRSAAAWSSSSREL